ncbi:hypothetical protein FQB35_11660 [Crassaminicella thermophila]|uniref:Uncharacterized protein n=1 Tax=Crassaminicella thermophila TaxID=2599308 RepID=A0A5C0SGY2_CRATE|nr:hypothetical protein [Crassaminicella thermophila]QEK12927.1 hypothetical protein FQB35_11660 [Crassaminicella thermophila]
MIHRKKNTSIKKLLWSLIILGFLIMEFPGVFFINRIDPIILGFPFIYGFMLIMWLYMCIITFIGYKTNWGSNKNFQEKNDITHMKGDHAE